MAVAGEDFIGRGVFGVWGAGGAGRVSLWKSDLRWVRPIGLVRGLEGEGDVTLEE